MRAGGSGCWSRQPVYLHGRGGAQVRVEWRDPALVHTGGVVLAFVFLGGDGPAGKAWGGSLEEPAGLREV